MQKKMETRFLRADDHSWDNTVDPEMFYIARAFSNPESTEDFFVPVYIEIFIPSLTTLSEDEYLEYMQIVGSLMKEMDDRKDILTDITTTLPLLPFTTEEMLEALDCLNQIHYQKSKLS